MAFHGAIASRPLSRGDVVLVRFPYTDLSGTKRRPAIVLWADSTQTDFTLAFVSSQGLTSIVVGEALLLPTHPEFSLTGLTTPSKIRATKIVTLSRALITRWLGRLGPLLSADLDRALIAGLSISTIPYREEGRREERTRLATLYSAGGATALLSDLGLP
jgi:mRNA interferase MazF